MNATSDQKQFISNRIQSIENRDVFPDLENNNGILLHFIPLTLIDTTSTNIINWDSTEHKYIIKNSFRRFTNTDTVYQNHSNRIEGYTPHNTFFNCYQNGIIEVYKSNIVIDSKLMKGMNYVKVDNLNFPISNFLDSAKIIHKRIYNSSAPYCIFITLLGINGTYFLSIDGSYTSTTPFPANNGRFEPFTLENIDENIMPLISNSLNQSIYSAAYQNWTI